MSEPLHEGDRVQLRDRAASADDVKNQRYFEHFRGLTGTVQKVYTGDEVAVEIDLDSLPEAIANRHREIREQMKSKWLDGLSEEAKGRLTEAELNFNLRYTVLAPAQDVLPLGDTAAAAISDAATTEPAAGRLTTEELEAREEAYLKNRAATGAGTGQ